MEFLENIKHQFKKSTPKYTPAIATFKNLTPAIQVKTVVDFMNNVELYSVYLQNIFFIKTILRFTLACSEAVPHHPPPLLITHLIPRY